MKNCLYALSVLLLLFAAANAGAVTLGVGAFGGVNMPVVQDDQGNGTAFGFMVQYQLFSALLLEPQVMIGQWSDPGTVDGLDLSSLDGSTINSFGIDGLLGGKLGQAGFKPYFVAGLGLYQVKNDMTNYDESKFGWSAGLGFAYGVSPRLDLDFRGKLLVAPQESGSKKAVTVTGGLIYNFNLGSQ